MPNNVEIKARLEDFDAFHTLFKKVYKGKYGDCKTLEQSDTYFRCEKGRLKLREVKSDDNQASAELIFYDRKDTDGPKVSDYVKHECNAAKVGTLKESLTKAYGTRGEVKKTRLQYLVENTRVHLDKVVGKGAFMELEVVLSDKQTAEDGEKIAKEFMDNLNITADMLVKGSYIDVADTSAEPAAAAAKNGTATEPTKADGDDKKAGAAAKSDSDAPAPMEEDASAKDKKDAKEAKAEAAPTAIAAGGDPAKTES